MALNCKSVNRSTYYYYSTEALFIFTFLRLNYSKKSYRPTFKVQVFLEGHKNLELSSGYCWHYLVSTAAVDNLLCIKNPGGDLGSNS
jgi:hypothetical protein